MFKNRIVIYKFIQELHFYVTGGDNDNELVLASVLKGFCDVFSRILRKVDKNEALENLDLILLCTDEILDVGVTILDKRRVMTHFHVRNRSKTLTQALGASREHITRSLLT